MNSNKCSSIEAMLCENILTSDSFGSYKMYSHLSLCMLGLFKIMVSLFSATQGKLCESVASMVF